MWTPENIAALCTGVAGVIGAVVVLIRQVQHSSNPDAHKAGGSGTSTSAS
jgi:hypothetical protein